LILLYNLQPAVKRAEMYIKVGLVLLCVELRTLGTYGAQSLFVAWVVTPLWYT